MIEISVSNVIATVTRSSILTAGMVRGRSVKFDFSSDWEFLNKTAVFTNGLDTRIVPEYKWVDGSLVNIPPEVLATPNCPVKCGVYGIDKEGNKVIPTLWVDIGRVFPSASPGEYQESVPPTPNTWVDLQNQIGNISKLSTKSKDNLVEAINEAAHNSGVTSWDELEDKPFETLEEVKEEVLKDVPKVEVPTKLSAFENDTRFITAEDIPETVTSWNDLEDKPFGDLETYVQKFLYKKSSLAVGTYTTTFIPSVPYSIESGGKYKVIVVGTGSGYRVEREYVATSVSSALVFLGSDSDDIYLSCTTYDSQYTITVKNLPASLGIEVYLYAFEMAPVPLDEKYIPDTIARKADIPEIPEVPAKLSEFENDKGFITSDDIPKTPTKITELENDAGFITAKDVPKGVTSWNDLEDKPFDEIPPLFDIQWDGNMDGRDTVEVGEGNYLVKVSDDVYTAEQVLGAIVYYSDNYNEVISEDDIYTDIPGILNLWTEVFLIYSADELIAAMGLPEGSVSNGVWVANVVSDGSYITRFVSPTLLDEKHIPDTIARKSDIPESVTSWNDLEDKPVFAEVATSGSWNDLTDKPFGESATEWKLVASGEQIGSSVHDVTMNFTAVVGRTYGLKVYGIENGGKSIIVIRYAPCTAVELMPGYTLYQISESGTSVYGQSGSTNKQWTFHSVETGPYGLIINVYEEVEVETTLDEKYIPDTIARKSDIPESSIPFFDLEAMGMEPHTIGGDTTQLFCDTTEILTAMRKGIVGFKIPTAFGSARVFGTTLEVEAMNTPQMTCSFVLDGVQGVVFISADDESIWVESKMNSTDELVESVIASLPIYNGEVESV